MTEYRHQLKGKKIARGSSANTKRGGGTQGGERSQREALPMKKSDELRARLSFSVSCKKSLFKKKRRHTVR